MAEEDFEAEGAPAASASARPMRYLLLIMLIMLMEAAVGYLVLDRAIPVREDVMGVPEEEETEVEAFVEPIFYEDLKQIVINPLGARSNRLVQLSLALEVDSKEALEELKIKHLLVWDLVLRALEPFSLKEIRDSEKQAVREALTEVLNNELKNGEVRAVYVTEIVAQ